MLYVIWSRTWDCFWSISFLRFYSKWILRLIWYVITSVCARAWRCTSTLKLFRPWCYNRCCCFFSYKINLRIVRTWPRIIIKLFLFIFFSNVKFGFLLLLDIISSWARGFVRNFWLRFRSKKDISIILLYSFDWRIICSRSRRLTFMSSWLCFYSKTIFRLFF